jgi:DNA-directed RNA polymerase subunit RPC12/RpoP
LGKRVKPPEKQFSCVNCGRPFEVYPPDDKHNFAARKESDVKDPIKIDYKCEYCGNINTIFWGYIPVKVFVGRF